MGYYKWGPGLSRSVSADVAGSVCERIAERGNLTPKALVDESRPQDAPLHQEFEWDDAVAAEAYREVQAGGIIRQLVTVVKKESEEVPTRAFVSVRKSEEEPKSYVGINIAIKSPDMRSQLLASAIRDAELFHRKYKTLSELADVISAIENHM